MHRHAYLALGFILAVGSVASLQTRAAAKAPHASTVLVINGESGKETELKFPGQNQGIGSTVAISDLGNDGKAEIIVGAGIGNAPRVSVYDKKGNEIGSFLAYAPSSGVGVNVATCDVDGDGTQEIITAPQRGGGPHVRIFSNWGKPVDGGGFFVNDTSDRQGVNITCGDLDNDGSAELVTLPYAGNALHVRVWKRAGTSMKEWMSFDVMHEDDKAGLVGAIHDNILTLMTARGTTHNVLTYTFATNSAVMLNTETYTDEARGVLGIARTRDNHLVIASAQHTSLRDISTSTQLKGSSDVLNPSFAIGDIDADGIEDRVIVNGRPVFGVDEGERSIVVDISEQRLYAYEHGILTNTFLISSAKAPWQTPLGKHEVLAKLPVVRYAWFYGRGNPENYDLGLIPYNLRFAPHIYIHYAPWNEVSGNFGTPVSHGCVNVSLANIKWIYAWADVGVPVIVQT